MLYSIYLELFHNNIIHGHPDVAAGSILIKEAGGVITDFGGGNDYLRTGTILAGNTDDIHGEPMVETRAFSMVL